MKVAVIFSKKMGKRRWWNIFTGREFSHCWVVYEFGKKVVVLDPLIWGILINVHGVSLDEYMKEMQQHPLFKASCLLNIEYQPRDAVCYRGIYSCVSIVKAALGIEKWNIITPRQLYLYLKGRESV